LSGYAELHCHTNFSFLEGASHPEALAARAVELGLSAVAVTDHNGLYGAPRFAQAAAEAGLAAIVGAELTLTVERQVADAREAPATVAPRRPRLRATDADQETPPPSPAASEIHLTLLVEDAAGYANLCRLLSKGQLGGSKGAPRLTPADLPGAVDGLICLSGCRQGPLAAALLRRDRAAALAWGQRLARLFGPGRFWVEAQHHRRPEDRRLLAELSGLAERLHVGLVATNAVLYARRSDRPLQDVLTCIKHRTTLERAGSLLRPNAEFGLKSADEMAELFVGYPQAIRNTLRIAERCAFRLQNLGYRFPSFPAPPGETPFSYLYALCQQGARERYGPMRPEVSRQLAHELELIQKLGLAEYFLIVWDIMRFARERGILAQGRGSAANSVVAYVLGITNVDPIALNLLFERFLSEERAEAPDIDIDFASKDREQVIQYVYQRYGREHAGMVCEVITYRPRSAVRDVGKALGLSLEQVDRLAKAIDHRSLDDLERALPSDPASPAPETGPEQVAGPYSLAPDERRPPVEATPAELPACPGLLPLVRAIQHFPRHLGIHVGGMIVTREPLGEVVPLEHATMPGRTVVQWDKDDVAAMGLVKIDLLGLGMLSLLQEAIALVEQHHGRKIDLAKLGYDDPAVYDLLCRADAIGLFQVESRAQMNTLPRLKPRTFYDLVIEISLIRPGPIQGGSVHPYLRRRAGLEPVVYPHPKLQPVLEKTLGVPLFQEQGMRLAVVAAGFSPGKADQLRRAMGHKRSRERMAELYEDLMGGMEANGIPREVGRQVWKQLSAFADYGFPESHAASFALLVYASAYLKLYYPAEFTCAILNSQPMGFYPPAVLVADARRHGVQIRPVDLNLSRAACTVEHDHNDNRPAAREPAGAGRRPPVANRGAVRLGFSYVKGLGETVGARLEAARASGPFRDLRDFCGRTGLDRRLVERLIAVGVFDRLGRPRRELLWEVPAILEELRAGELPGLAAAAEPAGLEPPSELEEANLDYRLLGLPLSRHALEFYRPTLLAQGVRTADELPELRSGLAVSVAGLVICRQAPPTAGGHVFMTLEDETGLANVIVRPQVYQRERAVALGHPVVIVQGRLQNQEGAISVLARRFIALGQEHLAGTVPARNFH
jgi:error-prone DNA polymerase